MQTPAALPARANPKSEESRLLGPLIPQRISAIRRRYFTEQTGKLRAPIAVQVTCSDPVLGMLMSEEDKREVLKEVGLSEYGVKEGQARLDQLELSAVPNPDSLPLPPKRLQTPSQRSLRGSASTPRALSKDDPLILSPAANNSKWHRPKSITPRFMRRRAQDVLARSPIFLVEQQLGTGGAEVSKGGRVRMSVTKSGVAKGGVEHLAQLGKDELGWMKLDEELVPNRSGGKPKRNG